MSFFLLHCGPTTPPEKKESVPQQKEKKITSIISYLQQKENIKNSASLVLTDSEEWKETIKKEGNDILSALRNVYFQKKIDHLYIVSEKKIETEEASFEVGLPGINIKDPITLKLPPRDLQLLHSNSNLMLYRYQGNAGMFTIPKSDGISKAIDWIKWKLMDALFPVRVHMNMKSYLTGESSTEFIVKNRFSYFFVSKDAILFKSPKDTTTMLLLVYAQKSNDTFAQSVISSWASVYIVDKHRKMEVLNMADINPDIEQQHLGEKKGWLLRAQIIQVPHRTQGIGFAIRSDSSIQFDDFLLFILAGNKQAS